jgi:hypothetical protein
VSYEVAHEDLLCANSANLGKETHEKVAFTSDQNCGNYVIAFGMDNRGCDGSHFSFNGVTNECYCSFFVNCYQSIAIDNSNITSYTFYPESINILFFFY